MAEEKKTSKKAEKADSKKADKKSDKKKSKKNPFKSIAGFFKSVRSEGKKVVWPTGKEVVKNTLVVLLVVFIVGLAIYAVDTGLTLGMKGIKNLATTESTSASQTADLQTTSEALEESTTQETTAESTTAK